MDIRLHNMGVDPHQYRNALRETNERNRVYLQKFCYVWYGVCLVSVLTQVVVTLFTKPPRKEQVADLTARWQRPA